MELITPDSYPQLTSEQLVLEKQNKVKIDNASSPAFYASLLSSKYETNPQATVDLYQKIKTDLESTGTSPDYDSVLKLVASDADVYNRKAIANVIVNPNIPDAEKQAIVSQYIKDRELDVNITQEYLQQMYAAEEPDELEDAETKFYDTSFIFDRIKYYDDVQAATNKVAAEFDPSVKAGLLGFGEMVLPFVEAYSIQKVKEDVFGEESLWSTIKNVILFGENKKAIRDALERMPYDKRSEATQKLLSGISNLPGMDFKKMYMIQDLIEDPKYATWQRGIDDIVGLLDASLVGVAIKPLVRGIAKSEVVGHILPKKTPLQVTAEANKTLSTKLAAAALDSDTGDIAKAVGGSKGDIAATMVLPKWSDDVIRDVPDDVIDELTRIEKVGNDILTQVSTHGINYDTAEKIATMERINAELASVGGMKLHLNKSIIAQKPLEALQLGEHMEGYSGIAMFGSTVKNGFSTALKALERAGTNFKDTENIILYKKEPKTGAFSIVTDLEQEVGKKGSYFIGYKFNHVYNPLDVAIYGGDAVTKLGASKYGGYLFDVVSRFNRLISDASLLAADKASAIEKRLLDVVGKDVVKLSNDGKRKVFYALEEGARAEAVFDVSYLKLKLGLNDREVKAYYSYRKVSDIMWSLTNNEMVRKLRAEGMQSVRTTGNELTYYAKPLEDSFVKGNVREVYNPVTGVVEGFNPRNFDALVAGGGSVGRLSRPMRIGNRTTDYILIDGRNTKVGALGDSVLPYIDGYFQRTYKEFYFVDKIPSEMIVNGSRITDRTLLIRDHGQTIAGFATKKEADEYVKGLSEATGETYVARRGNEYENFYEKDFELYKAALSSTKRRGHHLEGYGEKGLANIEDPIESLFRSVRALSSRLAYDDLLESMKARWMNSYGHFVPATDGTKRFPNSADQLLKQAGTIEDYKKAKSLLEHIATMSRVPAKSDKMWQSFMMDFSETLEKLSPSVSVGVKELGQVSPTGILRKLPSVLFIALRPLRQVLVQSLQLLQYTFVDPKYIMGGGFSKDMIGLSIARATLSNPEMYARSKKAGAKLMGVSEKEYDEIVDIYFNKSGLPYSIDSNFYIEGLVRNIHETTLLSPAKRAAHGVANTGKKVVQYAKAAGFDIGEFTNLTGAWLIARKKWIDANPTIAHKWKEKAFQDQITAHAREISYAMSTPGTFKYQKGILAVPFQFAAVPHKALLSMLPEAMGGSKAFSSSDKVRIAAANLIWFGGAGFGINSVIDSLQDELGVELPPEVNMAIRGGMIDMSLNYMFNVIEDDKKDISTVKFADSFAPLSGGLFFHDTMSKLLYEDWRSAVFGPSYNIVGFENSRMSRAYNDIAAITSLPDMSTPEKIKTSMLAVASLASGVSDYMKYRYAMSTGKMVSARGDGIINATRTEAIAKLFGFSTYKEEDLYSFLKESYDEEKELKQYAKDHYEAIERIYKLYGDNDRDTLNMHFTAWQSMLASLDPHERKYVASQIESISRQKLKTTQDSLINRMLSWASYGGDARESIIKEVMRTNGLTEDQKRSLLQLLDDGMNGEFLNGK